VLDYSLVRWADDICIIGAILGCAYALLASLLVFRYSKGRDVHPGSPIPVTILKPLHGAEPRLFSHLTSFCNQDYPAPIQIIFGTLDRDDPAVKIVERLKKAFPDRSLEIKIDSREHGSNRKISNLINMLPAARHDTLIIADSDINVASNYLADIVSHLQRPDVGAVTCLYHGIGGASVWSRLAATAINTHFLPLVTVALRFRLARPCFGATIGMRRDTLNRIGGFSAFADYLADDYAIGQAVRRLGDKVVISHVIVGHVCFERDFAALLAQQVRFARTIRSIDPIGYAGSIVVHPLPLALIAALMGTNRTALLLAAVLACRGVLCLSVKRALGLASQPYWLIPLQDLISFIAYLVGFFEIDVSWRGHKYRVLSDGHMVSDQTEGVP
jgi:ceramide glucosyltransferase